MRIAVCDDEERELARLSKLIAKYQEERGGGTCTREEAGTDRVF